ncbi:MAG TPA: helix-turn-helix domain-containing protein [Acidimicrobiales bacterium]|nr:helix-turn-helix domain-containing protein [Acidimicrobiales bacterium]
MAELVTDAMMFDAALAVLAERGYVGATTRRIAEAAGINEVTLFRRFGDKRQLILAAIHTDISRLADNGLTTTGDIEADLIRVVEYYTGIYQHRNGLVGTLLLEGARNPSVAALIQEPLGAMLRLAEIFAGYQRAGQMVEEPTEFAVQALLAPLLVITLLRRVTSSEIAVPDARTVVQRFLKGRLTERQTMT